MGSLHWRTTPHPSYSSESGHRNEDDTHWGPSSRFHHREVVPRD